jgi:hypothetical protein
VKYSIGITTYKYRFEKWLKPLLNQIKEFRPDIEVLVSVNGENNEEFDEEYRRNILEFVSSKRNTFLTMYPTFRGLCKMWNNLLIDSSNHHVLLLNDDITITSDKFFDSLEGLIDQGNNLFKINGSWSHAFLDRRIIDRIGWFDERYLGIGEEDGDFEWRLGKITEGQQVPTFFLPAVENHVDHENCLVGMKKVNNKYAKFNFDFAFTKKYRIDSEEGENYGIMNRTVVCDSVTPPLHTTESFYWQNRDEL